MNLLSPTIACFVFALLQVANPCHALAFGRLDTIITGTNGTVQNRRGIADALAASMYVNDARIPDTPWLAPRPPICITPVSQSVESSGTASARP